MRLHLVSLLILAAVLTAGCAAPQRQAAWTAPPSDPDYIVVEADGYSYLGDQDRLADARSRARQDAIRKAAEQGSRIFLSTYAREEFGVLKEDVVERAVAGILTDVQTLIDQLEGSRYHVRIRAKVHRSELGDILRSYNRPAAAPLPPSSAASGEVTVSFYDYTEVFIPRIYRVLAAAPGVTDLNRLWSGPSSLSYSLAYSGRLENLEDWLRRELRTSLVVPFRISTSDVLRRIDIYFDAGFD